MRVRAILGWIACMVGVFLACACSRTRKAAENKESGIHRVIPYTIRVRRPPGPGADPRVGPGGTDYTSHPLPNAKLDCETPEALFQNLNLREVRACLGALSEAGSSRPEVLYRLRRVAVPELSLEKETGTPDCLNAVLPSIPVPREIFFQSPESGRLLCYSSRLDVEADEIVGLKLPLHRLVVRISFPLEKAPSDETEARMLLLSWALTPFIEKGQGVFDVHIVPDAICRACIGERDLVKPNGPPPALWP